MGPGGHLDEAKPMKKFWISCLFAGMIVCQSFARSVYFRKYQVENGLSHNTIGCILQDSYGFMWFGTSDGLNRFDGKQFKIFRTDNQDKFPLGNNSVQALFVTIRPGNTSIPIFPLQAKAIPATCGSVVFRP